LKSSYPAVYLVLTRTGPSHYLRIIVLTLQELSALGKTLPHNDSRINHEQNLQTGYKTCHSIQKHLFYATCLA